jgi:hypothetical protein
MLLLPVFRKPLRTASRKSLNLYGRNWAVQVFRNEMVHEREAAASTPKLNAGAAPAMIKLRSRVAMEKRVRSTSYNRQFDAVGQGAMREVPEGVTCPYCHTLNEAMWPMDGAVFARTIPEYMEVSDGPTPSFED